MENGQVRQRRQPHACAGSRGGQFFVLFIGGTSFAGAVAVPDRIGLKQYGLRDVIVFYYRLQQWLMSRLSWYGMVAKLVFVHGLQLRA